MAKKTVAAMQEKTVRVVKVIQCKRKEKNGNYSFFENIVPIEKVKDFLEQNK